MTTSRRDDNVDSMPVHEVAAYRQKAEAARKAGEKERAKKLYKKSIQAASVFLEENPEDNAQDLRSEIISLRKTMKRQVHRLNTE